MAGLAYHIRFRPVGIALRLRSGGVARCESEDDRQLLVDLTPLACLGAAAARAS